MRPVKSSFELVIMMILIDGIVNGILTQKAA